MHVRGGRGTELATNPAERPVLNAHVHIPPNFSAFDTAEDAVRTAAAEGIRVMGVSNFHDHRIYARFRDEATTAGIVALYGIEIIAVDGDLERAGVRVNDPANPGRVYMCGKGVDPFVTPSETARHLVDTIRAADIDRMGLIVPRMRARFEDAGLRTALTYENIADEVAERAGVPLDWVVLQERHVARAFQEALFLALSPDRRAPVLANALGRPSQVAPEDSIAVQAEIRSGLMKAGRPAYVPESPISLADAYQLVLESDGIPCYPTLADGAEPVCPWEDPPTELAARLRARGIHAAELIPNRNRPEVVDAYVAAFRSAGIIVTAGTEHNTGQRIPMEPRCVDGSLPSPAARDAFWEGTCVIAAHQHLRAQGRLGYVASDGTLNPGFPDAEARISWFAAVGAEHILAAAGAGTR